MCGRYSITTPPEAVWQLFRLTGPIGNLPVRYNVAPTQDAPVVRLREDSASAQDRELAFLRWGLVPHWSKGPDPRFSMVNAKSETVATKPAYREPYRRRRCLVPADGFYEWKKQGGAKQPWRFTLKDGAAFAFAGLWDRWTGPDGNIIQSFTVLTTEPNALVAPIHDRMPVIVRPSDHEAWLTAPSEEAGSLLRPYPADDMAAYPVSTIVNSPRHDVPECVQPLAPTRSLL